ncbi:ABC transporter ATP-binding protein [Devosia ginsengisoli]|uniref:ABC transporter ATP-binding protein n=1 Tax=Devosia ginsengisoli TaxID=400770 RepID=A0A5B8LXK3_9HYPH|nr:ABC transporter ATP-binding protein [Devosia ginsengisoli]QDZ12756.1 ABC transporter ATP-binding protein [Devosia ginsengisoli]
MSSALLDVSDLEVAFDTRRGRVKAVDGLSFSLDKGEIIALVGESGCGKSVAVRSVLKLLPEQTARYEGGSITLEGKDLLKLDDRAMQKIRGRDVALIFQDPMSSLNPVLTIGKQIGEAIKRHQGGSRRQVAERTIDLLRRVGIPAPETRLKAYPHEFSGGMRQRVMIAMALSCNPRVILADEITTALDVTIQAQIIDLLKSLVADAGAAVVMITHDMGIVAGAAERVYVMYAGTVVETATTADLFAHPAMPYTWGLLRSIPSLERPVDEPLVPIEGLPPDVARLNGGCRFRPRCAYRRAICGQAEPPLAPTPDGVEGHLARCWGLDPDQGWLRDTDWTKDLGDPVAMAEISAAAAHVQDGKP